MILVVDGGATKTVAVVYDLDSSEIIGIGVAGSSSIRNVTLEGARKNIKEAVSEALEMSGGEHMEESLFGLTGVGDSNKSTITINNMLAEEFKGLKKTVTNDGEQGYMLVTLGRHGNVVAAGTGSVGFGFNGIDFFRIGGWGWLTGDGGSAYWIAKKGLEMAEKSYDGIVDDTMLIDLFEKRYEDDLKEIVSDLGTKLDVLEMASLAPIVSDAAEKGDKVAKGILKEAVEEIETMVKTMDRIIAGDHTRGCVGGVMQSQLVTNQIRKDIPDIKIFFGYKVAVGGILTLLKNRKESINENLRDTLVHQLDEKFKIIEKWKQKKYLYMK